MLDIVGAPSLADAVHGKLRVAQVQRADAHLGRQHGTNCASTRRVVANHEKLQRHGGFLGHLLEEDDAGGIGSITLVCIDWFVGSALSDWGMVVNYGTHS